MSMDLKNRKRVIFWVRLGLIFGTIVFVTSWLAGRVSNKLSSVQVQREAPAATALGPGDVSILTADGSMDVILSGDKILVGLSPATVAKVRDELAKETGKETGLGAVIAGAVKSGVASAIGTHVSYPLSNVKEIVYDGRQLKLITKDGDTHGLSGDSKDGNRKKPQEFEPADAERFIAAVNARKKELGIP